MLKQQFRVGDLVYNHTTGAVVKIFEAIYCATETEQMKGEYWAYRVQGDIYPIMQNGVKSATPCPNCAEIGWDWVTGCGVCGLSPEDGE